MFEKKMILSNDKSVIWDKSEKTQFVHLAEMGVPMPPFYFEKDKVGRYHVLDILNGVRRFNAITEHTSEEDDFVFKSTRFRVNILINPTAEEIQLLKNILD